MLTQLYIQNIAVIEKALLELKPGLNVFTGETGAGKSILIGAISAVLGFRTSRDLIRTGADRAVVTALFEELSSDTIEILSSFGYEPEEDGTLLLSRELSSEGKSFCKIGGRPATVSILRAVAQTLINIHGQHDSQALLSPEQHIRLLDGFADTQQLVKAYREEYRKMQALQRELEKLNLNEAEKAYRIDLLQYQIDEISAAQLKPEEEEELMAQKKAIHNAEYIVQSIHQADGAFHGDEEAPGFLIQLDRARAAIAQAAHYYKELEPMAERMEEIYYELKEYSSDIRSYATELEFEPADIDQIEQRLDIIYKLKQKYGRTVKDILNHLEKATAELDTITCSDKLQKKLQAQLDIVTDNAKKRAQALSQARLEAAERFVHAVGEELRFLDMPFVKLKIRNVVGSLGPEGIDNLEFLISTNPGEPAKPLSKVASGGELSRIMLSLKNVTADEEQISTMIFDEVDTGVSGRAAQKIGQKLKQASKGRQILCVTHLAQVACFADCHWLIEKNVRAGRTYTEVRALSEKGRVYEIARIIGGEQLTDTVLQSAKEMLELSCGN